MSEQTIKRTWVRIKFLLLLAAIVAALIIATGFMLRLFANEIPRDPLRVENKTGVAFSHMALFTNNQLIIQHSASEDVRQAVFPKVLLQGAGEAVIIGITKEGQVWQSPKVAVNTRGSQQFEYAVQASNGVVDGLGDLPSLLTWAMNEEGKQARAAFMANTGLSYQVVVLGKGSQLSLSDFGTQGTKVLASWERGRGPLMSWLVLKP